MYLKTRALYPETQQILGIAFLIMLGFSRGTFRYYFRRLPWYALAIPIAILLYGIWHLSMGFGTLNEMPPDIRVVAKYHQMIFGHSLFISGYTFYCLLWSYITWEQFPKKKRA
jgi:amino acid transporter